VIEMTRAVSVSLLGSEFDDFLYAPVGEDGNEMRLSVLSAIAGQSRRQVLVAGYGRAVPQAHAATGPSNSIAPR